MSRDPHVWTHWTEHIDDAGNWIKRERRCPYCAVMLGARRDDA